MQSSTDINTVLWHPLLYLFKQLKIVFITTIEFINSILLEVLKIVILILPDRWDPNP